ncbi:Ni/Fe hydrogenase subunit alpha [Nocardia speluncae]|uniref:Ni/Fe hydrogenase subunit alpha n=1 Tax=Nocardia speluncae TaxID=419477 RepID=A0A846XEA5_9NOCA|nr:Ni/Fe hydrogenase subunit alpha [Nocardia speluncae]NKY32943.1 Ni/Fe hydrogenase subunit alpha [Nocardia speluncae]
MPAERRTLTVDSLARVEGEGALHIVVHEGAVESAELRIYEPPRFFEALLRGRAFTEPPDITSRICGICPVAYQVSACNALEQVCEAELDPPLRALRRLLYCGEWIASHCLHIFLLHLPDILGFPDAVALAQAERALVEQGLALKKAGNALLELIGGRAIHPVNVKLGGFYSTPEPRALTELAEQLRRGLDDAVQIARRMARFDFPSAELGCDFVAVTDAPHYAIETGEVRTSGGQTFPAAGFAEHITEQQVRHSTALHATLDGRQYLTGPLARYTLNSAQLSPIARELAADIGLDSSCRNPFRSILVRLVEVVYALDEALRLIADYRRPPRAAVPVRSRPGTGHGVSEAPRGLLYHRYELDTEGIVRTATIVPPTSQNQSMMEEDLRRVVGANLHLSDAELTTLCETTIRNYDPCISCSAHFLALEVTGR